MATPIEFIKENELAWQPSFSGDLSNDTYGYRGALIIEPGKQISPDRKLPPKIQAKQVIIISEAEKIKFLTCELESFHHLAPMVEKYKDFFTSEGLYLLYVTDLEKAGTFEYEGIKFTAFPLDESSVWNELLDLADLEKSDMKRLKKQEEKIETLYDELLDTNVEESSKTYDEMLTFVGESSKQLMGAV
ncbi:hypothetical protein [Halarcobacter anaerophilus]|jgi:hypothetical protein|uniref:Uncharacterized protein n=1 Tax=Halarcobacter anaerophilus TaxID=877500 RepID=A0A4V1LQF7_9BACT|nr:hypothetical protein [Halarcobacter anaerophilus]QDF29288.1 hypothetical protein AANAER_1814 [Halarcobacter anaerophilus]RXJ64538.1 hypothetical protein CRV06_00855 [Halarcobacter anaerophilus]